MASMRVRLIGVDWACAESKRGIAVVDCAEESIAIVDLSSCSSRRTALDVIRKAITSTTTSSVIAIDAPLGWPVGLSQGLLNHAAGEDLSVAADFMFSRETDRFVRRRFREKKPLEVGANLIARTAHSANRFLHQLRAELTLPVPLLWSRSPLSEVGVIEVYPAVTKIACRGRSLGAVLNVEEEAIVCANEHVQDALWCAVTGLHFIRGECYEPADVDTSRREGWIWFKRTEAELRDAASDAQQECRLRK